MTHTQHQLHRSNNSAVPAASHTQTGPIHGSLASTEACPTPNMKTTCNDAPRSSPGTYSPGNSSNYTQRRPPSSPTDTPGRPQYAITSRAAHVLIPLHPTDSRPSPGRLVLVPACANGNLDPTVRICKWFGQLSHDQMDPLTKRFRTCYSIAQLHPFHPPQWPSSQRFPPVFPALFPCF